MKAISDAVIAALDRLDQFGERAATAWRRDHVGAVLIAKLLAWAHGR